MFNFLKKKKKEEEIQFGSSSEIDGNVRERNDRKWRHRVPLTITQQLRFTEIKTRTLTLFHHKRKQTKKNSKSISLHVIR